MDTRGWSLPSWSSMITRRERPVASSNSSRMVTPSTMSRNMTAPLTSVRMGVVNGSHSTSSLPMVTLPSSLILIRAPGTTGYRSFSRPPSSTTTLSPLRLSTTMSPSRFTTERMLWYLTRPACLASCLDASTTRLAVPPIWKVLMVSCVPGSPMRLGGDDAHRLPELRETARAEVAPVAHDADASLRLAGEGGADAHALETRVFDLLRQLFVDLRSRLDDDLAREGVADVLGGHPAQHAVAERLDDVATLHERGGVDVLHGAAVVLGHDHVLGHVDEPAGQIPGVRRLERGVGETLARPVGGGEVLQHGQAFPVIRGDRRLDDLARRLGHEAAHARELPDLLLRASGTRVGHHIDGVELTALLPALQLAEHGVGDLLCGVRPDVDDLVVALPVGDDPVLVLLLHLVDLPAGPLDQLTLGRGDVHVLDTDGEPGQRGVAETDVLEVVEEGDGHLVAQPVVAIGDEGPDLLLLELLVHEAERLGHDVVEQSAAHRRLDHPAVVAQTDSRLQVHVLVVIGNARLFRVGEEPALALGAGALFGQVVDPEDHVLGGDGHGGAVGRRQDVVGREHQHLRLHLRFHGEGHVHGHLVAVEVRVEGGADEGMDLDGLALDEDRLEGLNTQAVESRRAVQEHRMLRDDLLEDVPHLRPLLLHELLGRLDGRGDAPLLQLAEDEGLEELEGHLLRQTALVELEVRPHHDHGAPGIVHALAEEVLPEAALLALEGVGERLEGPVVRARDDPAAPPVVEQRVHRLLEHPLLVPDDDLGRPQLHQPLQPVVPIDDAPVEIVEVRGGETAAVQGHERT